MKKKKAARRKRKKLKQNKVVSLTANTSAGGQKQILNRKEKKILLKMADFSTVIQLEFLREKSTRQKLFYISNYVVKSQNDFDIEKKRPKHGLCSAYSFQFIISVVQLIQAKTNQTNKKKIVKLQLGKTGTNSNCNIISCLEQS